MANRTKNLNEWLNSSDSLVSEGIFDALKNKLSNLSKNEKEIEAETSAKTIKALSALKFRRNESKPNYFKKYVENPKDQTHYELIALKQMNGNLNFSCYKWSEEEQTYSTKIFKNKIVNVSSDSQKNIQNLFKKSLRQAFLNEGLGDIADALLDGDNEDTTKLNTKATPKTEAPKKEEPVDLFAAVDIDKLNISDLPIFGNDKKTFVQHLKKNYSSDKPFDNARVESYAKNYKAIMKTLQESYADAYKLVENTIDYEADDEVEE